MSEALEKQEEIVQQPTPSPVIEVEPAVDQTELIEISEDEGDALPPTETVQTPKPFDPKTDKVEFTTPEQQKKFDYIYKQTKMSDARNQMLTDLLKKQQERLDSLENRYKQTDEADAEATLLGRIKAARLSGDDEGEIAATKEMVEFLADKKIAERTRPSQAQQIQEPIGTPEAKYVYDLMQEKDASGNPIRPWLYDGHPDQEIAVAYLEENKMKYAGDPYGLPKTLAELDQYMGTVKMTQKPTPPSIPSRAPSPLQGGNLTNVKQKATIKLTRQELEIAKKLGVDPKRYAAKRDELKERK